MVEEENQENHRVSPVWMAEANNSDGHASKRDTKLIDLNIKPYKLHDQSPNNQVSLAYSLCFSNLVSNITFVVGK